MSRSFLDLGTRLFTYEYLHLLFSETTKVGHFNQILYVSFLIQEKENLLTGCWSHDQDDSHAHIYMVKIL